MKQGTLKKFTIGLLIFCVTGCILSCNQAQDEIHNSEGAKPVMEQGQEPLPKGVLIPDDPEFSMEEIMQLEAKQITWGPGSILDSEGRPEACVRLQEQYGKYSAWFLGQNEDRVYLTFDEGYENGYTARILDVLKEKNVTAVFFATMDYVVNEPELVQRMVDEGHTVGNHTWSHPDMSKIENADAFAAELQKVEEKFQEITGQALPKYYRPPQGIYSEANLKLAQELGYKTVFWSLAYADWDNNKQPSAEQAFSKLIPRVHNGAVVLLHSTSRTNAAILDELLTRWEDLGYRFGTMEELFA